jgi:hypothetical protein
MTRRLILALCLICLSGSARAQDSLSDLIRWQATKDAPEQPNSPAPNNGMVNVQPGIVLGCLAAGATKGVDIYLGTTSPPPLAGHVPSCVYAPPAPLLPNTTYFWKVIARNPKGTGTSPGVWVFTTAPAPPTPPTPPTPKPLTLICPADFSVPLPANASTVAVTYQIPIPSGGVDPVTLAICSPGPGGAFKPGPTLVQCQTADSTGAMPTCQFTITVTSGP